MYIIICMLIMECKRHLKTKYIECIKLGNTQIMRTVNKSETIFIFFKKHVCQSGDRSQTFNRDDLSNDCNLWRNQ